MKLIAKVIDNNDVLDTCEISNTDWELLCDSLIGELLYYIEDIHQMENIIKEYRCRDKGCLLRSWIHYNESHHIHTMRSFIYAIESQRPQFLRLLITYELVGLYFLMLYDKDEGYFSEGQVCDIARSLDHMKHFAIRENNCLNNEQKVENYIELLEKISRFFSKISNMTSSIIVEYIW